MRISPLVIGGAEPTLFVPGSMTGDHLDRSARAHDPVPVRYSVLVRCVCGPMGPKVGAARSRFDSVFCCRTIDNPTDDGLAGMLANDKCRPRAVIHNRDR